MHREMGGNNWESLLRRPCLEAGESPQNTTDSGRTILLTGAGGCIGAALAKVIITSDPRLVILLDHSEHNLHQIQTELAAIAGRVPPIAILGDVCDGALLTDVGAQSWVMSTGKVTDGVYTPARHLRVDDTPIAPYRTGLACGA